MSVLAGEQGLAHRILVLEESQTIGMAKRARELAAQGHDVINLSFGEPDFQTPDHIKAAAKQAIDEGFTFYTPVPGIPELRKGIVAKLKRDNGLDYAPEQIVVSTGAKQSIANTVLCLVNPGDEVIILGPYWVSYLEIVKLAEGVPVVVSGSIENNFRPDVDQLRAAVNERTKAIIYSSPSNPTGAMLTRTEFDALAAILRDNPQVYAIADEIYEYISYGSEHISLASYTDIKDQVVLVNGFSKGFAMTGWRVGYIAAARHIANACDKMQGQFTSATCSIAQKAAVAAINGPMDFARNMTEAFLRRRDMMLKEMAGIPGWRVAVPDGAFYLFPEVKSSFGKQVDGKVISDSTDLCNYLLGEAHVSIVPGCAFGNDDCIRISFAAADDKLFEAMQRIKRAMARLS